MLKIQKEISSKMTFIADVKKEDDNCSHTEEQTDLKLSGK